MGRHAGAPFPTVAPDPIYCGRHDNMLDHNLAAIRDEIRAFPSLFTRPRPHRITFECADPTLWVDGACACNTREKK